MEFNELKSALAEQKSDAEYWLELEPDNEEAQQVVHSADAGLWAIRQREIADRYRSNPSAFLAEQKSRFVAMSLKKLHKQLSELQRTIDREN